jgi:hypothetical protein
MGIQTHALIILELKIIPIPFSIVNSSNSYLFIAAQWALFGYN